jgi:hypothetical protein
MGQKPNQKTGQISSLFLSIILEIERVAEIAENRVTLQ